MRLIKLILFLVLCAPLFGQGGVIGGGSNGVVGSGSSGVIGGQLSLVSTVTVEGAGVNTNGNGPFVMTGVSAAVGDDLLVGCVSTPVNISITAFSGTSGTLTFTATNTLSANQTVKLGVFTSGNTGLNGQLVTVLSSGLSTSQFSATVTGSGYASGTGQAVASVNLAITDSGSNTWTYPTSTGGNSTLQFLDPSLGVTSSIAYSKITTALSGGTVTYTSGGFVQAQCSVLDIYHGASTVLDQIAGLETTFGTTFTTASITPSLQPEIAIALMGFPEGASNTFSSFGTVIGTTAQSGVNLYISTATGLILEWRRITATTAGTSTAIVTTSQKSASLFFTIESN
jgi:hypothetical protein